MRLVSCSLLLILGAALAAPGQAPAPASKPAAPKPPISAEELARRKELLSSRTAELYELFRTSAWRKAAAYVAEDSQDVYYEMHKGPILGFTLTENRISPDGTSAIVVVEIKSRIADPRFPNPVSVSQKTRWVYERDNWFLKLERMPTNPLAPFLANMPGGTKTTDAVRFDKTEQDIARGSQQYVFRFENTSKEKLTLKTIPDDCLCMDASVDKESYAPGELGEVRVKMELEPTAKPRDYTIQVMILPGPRWSVIRLHLK